MAGDADDQVVKESRQPVTAWRWPVVACALIAGAVLLLRECTPAAMIRAGGDAGGQALDRGAALWQRMTAAQLTASARDFVSGMPVLQEQMSLVVATLDLQKSMMASNNKRRFGIDFGTTTVAMSVPARIHYAVDLSGEQAVSFAVDSRGVFTAVFPDPEVQAVETFSQDRQTVVEVGWARLRSQSGHQLEDQLERDLYEAVRDDGNSARALHEVRQRARPVLARFVALYLQDRQAWGDRDGFSHIRVRFRSELDDSSAPVGDFAAGELELGRIPRQP